MIETRPNNNSNGEIPKGQIVSAYDHLVQLKGSFQDAPFLDVQQNLYKLLFTPLSERSYDQPMSIKRENVNFFLTHIGLNPQKTTDAWDKSHSSKTWGTNDGIKELGQLYYTNFTSLCALESAQPGSAQVLADEFNMYNFSRYTDCYSDPQLLVDQYNQRDDHSRPYGIVISPRDDHNNAHWRLATMMNEIKKATEDTYAIRVYEVENQYEMAKALLTADRRYGRKGNKISFGILAAHGSSTTLRFGKGKSGVISTTDTFFHNTSWQERFKTMFDEHATIIMKACSAGADDGIAEQLARALDVTTIGPEKDTTTTTIKAEQTSQGIIFDVSYADMKGKFFLTPPKEYLVQTKIYTS